MKQVTPAVRNLAQWLLAQEADESEHAATEALTALRVLDKLRLQLSRLVGVAGHQALLSRSLALAKAEVPWLEAVRIQTDGSLEGFGEKESRQNAKAAEGAEALLAQLLGLLITFIGEDLTLRLVRDIWQETPLKGTNLDAEETP